MVDDHQALLGDEKPDITPFESASTWSILFFRWLDPLFAAGSRRPLQLDDLPWLGKSNSARSLFQKTKGCQWLYLWRANRKLVIQSGIYTLLHLLASYAGPFLVADFVSTYSKSPKRAFAVASVFLFAKVAANVLERHKHFVFGLLAIRIDSALTCQVYQKSLRSLGLSVGEVVNLVTSDVKQVSRFSWDLHTVWRLPLQALIGLLILYRDVGLASLASIGALIACALLNLPLARLEERCQHWMMEGRDSRVQATAESLRSMRTLKLHGWELHFLRRIEHLRASEFDHLSRFSYVQALSKYLFSVAPLLMAVIAVALMEKISPGKILSAIAVFRMLQSMQDEIPEFISSLVGVRVSMHRLSRFLSQSRDVELQPERLAPDAWASGAQCAVQVKDACFSWGEDDASLSNVNLEISAGIFAAITGAVGSGKSSLLLGILGEMAQLSGQVNVSGSVAYVPQSAWIQHGSVRENILFGSEMNREKYETILCACQLKRDLEMLSHGDETRIGDRGVTLSGGQKQRLQLARALYKDADVYLLDDPLSALDVKTSEAILKECILGFLRTKTVLLVTHHPQCIQMADILIVMENGSLFVKRSPKGVPVEKCGAEEDEEKMLDDFQPKLREPEAAEQRETGSVSGSVYWAYLTSVYRGALVPVILISMIVYQGMQAAATWKIARIQNSSTGLVMMFGLLSLGSSVALLSRVILVALVGLAASQSFFLAMHRSVFSAQMSFFDTTPMGRILTRASTDQTSADIPVPLRLSELASYMIELLTIIVVVSIVSWHVIPVFLILASIAYYLQRYYVQTIREIPRLIEIQRAPIVHHFEESLSGLTTIRAFRQEREFLERLFHLVDVSNRPQFHNFSAMEFLALRIGILADLFFCFLMILLVVFPTNPGSAGVAVTYALNLTTALTWTLWSRVDAEKRIISVERLMQYTNLHGKSRKIEIQPPEDWPQLGNVEFKEVRVQYKPRAPLALCGLSIEFPAGKKIGIVGRTGSGKSTLIQALFRTVELASGRILIDGIDISAVDVHLLRSKLSIIPQDPVLFQGSVRYNLDPLGKFSDAQLWEVLRRCELMAEVNSKGAGLDSQVCGDGENWSMGERQLLCLGRVMLKKSKILVLDEATASMDRETEKIIQARLGEDFGLCTMITVAHRLSTIITSDLIAVLENGKLVEHGSPFFLSNNPLSIFGKCTNRNPG